MTDRAGNASLAVAWGSQWVGRWGYDHDAAARTRFGPMVPGQKFPSRSTLNIADCSGFVIRSLVEGGMPRYWQGFPESSGDMNRWADAHKDLLIYSIHGGGRTTNTHDAIVTAPAGAVFGVGDYLNGDAGHTGFLIGGGRTLESASSTYGVAVGDAYRFTGRHIITHVYEAPVQYAATPPPEGDDDLDAAHAQMLEDIHAALPLIRDLGAYVAERKRPIRQANDPPQYAGDRLLVDLHEFVLTENKDAILDALKPDA